MNFNIKQDPLNATLVSSIKAAYEFYYEEKLKTSMFYGLSGYAFVINVTNGLGPCAPYLWDMDDVNILTKENVGISLFEEEGSINKESTNEQKAEATNRIKKMLDDKHPVFLGSYEYQVIKGYEKNKFIVTTPWDNVPSVTREIEFNTLDGMLDFMFYSKIVKVKKGDLKKSIIRSLQYAIKLFENPSFTPDSAMGIKAYDFWLEKITDENAVGHGNWWTSTVWAECRYMASEFMQDIKPYFDKDEILNQLTEKYKTSSELLNKIADKELLKEQKIVLIKQLKENELKVYELLKKLI